MPQLYGPYKHRTGAILVTVADNGERTSRYFDTREEAEDTLQKTKAGLQAKRAKTVKLAIQEYLDYQERAKQKPNSITATRVFLLNLFRGYTDLILPQVTREKAKEIYDEMTRRAETGTHQRALVHARSLWRYLGLSLNPWVDVRPIGKKKRGKKKLTTDEAKLMLDYCWQQVEQRKRFARGKLGIITALLLGLRGCEVRGIQKRHYDKGGKILRIFDSKTESSKRSIEVPESLIALTKPYLRDLQSEDLVFPYSSTWLTVTMELLCAKLHLPRITGHSLRAMHADLASRAGSTSHAVAATLGHSISTGTKVTDEVYIGQEAIDARGVNRATEEWLH